MKSTRQRIIAGILTLVLLTGQAGGTIIYAESQDGDGTAPLTETEPTLEETQTMEEVQVSDNLQVTEIAGFTELPEEVRSRQAEYGTPQDELMLPEELGASVQGENVIIEGITWISDPEYNGEIPGAYIFTAVLPQESAYVPAEGVEMPKIDVMVEPQTEGSEDQPGQTEQTEHTEQPEQGKNSEENGADEDEGTDQDMTPEEEAAMLAGLESDPEILTEEDVLAAAPELATVQTYGLWSSAETHPATYFVGEDNENNAGTGSPDGDIDAYIRMNLSRHPIEVAIDIPEGQLPAVSAYLAVRTNDVDWQDGEYDLLYINDHRVAPLTGLSSQWNTSFYQIPVSYLKEGKNIVKVMINDIDPDDFGDDSKITGKNCWVVAIDWMQLVCDGGSREGVEEYSLTLNNAYNSGNKTWIEAACTIRPSGNSGPFTTEYSITDAEGYILGSYQGSGVSGVESFSISMPKNSETGDYKVQGLLKDSEGQILASDFAEFHFVKGEGVSLAPEFTHTLSPETLTNQDVTISMTMKDDRGYTEISPMSAEKRVQENGIYEFDYTYKDKQGADRSGTYKVTVSNIDKQGPKIEYDAVTVMYDAVSTDVESAVRGALTVTDNVTANCEVEITVPEDLRQYEGGTADVKVRAEDAAGNVTEQTVRINVEPMPLTIGQPTGTRQGTTDTFDLSAVLTATGGETITETGFVWGVMQRPTLSLNNGSASTSSPVTVKNGTLTAEAEDIAEGVTYYLRAYAETEDTVYYSEQTTFGIDAKSYGTFSIKNNGNNTFTVTRTGGTDGIQTVSFRTVNGSAVGSTHFEHQSGTLTFSDGETEKTITVTEYSVNAEYNKAVSTGYSNASRTYEVELYRVEGGGSLGTETRAARTMTGNNSVDGGIYDWQTINGPQGETRRGDFDVDGLGWSDGEKIGTAAIETISVKDDLLSVSRSYWTNTAQNLYYYLTFDAKEENSGYQAVQITPGNALDTAMYPYTDELEGSLTTSYYMALFEHGKSGGANGSWLPYTFPKIDSFPSGSTLTQEEKMRGKWKRVMYCSMWIRRKFLSAMARVAVAAINGIPKMSSIISS